MAICEEDGCTTIGEALEYPDGTPAAYCLEHMRDNGFCTGCYGFWGGVESFEFSRSGFCDECERNPDVMGYDPDDDEDDYMWEDSLTEPAHLPARAPL